MILSNYNNTIKKEEEEILSLLRISINFFGKEDDSDEENNEDSEQDEFDNEEFEQGEDDTEEPDQLEDDKEVFHQQDEENSGKYERYNNANSNNNNKKDKETEKDDSDDSRQLTPHEVSRNKEKAARVPSADEVSRNKEKAAKAPSSPFHAPTNDTPGGNKGLNIKQGLNAIKNAKNDPMETTEKLGTEAAKLGAKAVGGEAAAKAVEQIDKVLTKTETGKKLKTACCSASIGCSCLSMVLSLVLILSPAIVFLGIIDMIYETAKEGAEAIGSAIVSIFTSSYKYGDENVAPDNSSGSASSFASSYQYGYDKEPDERNFIHTLEEDTLNQPNKSLLTILEKTLEDVGYYEQKEAEAKGEHYEDKTGSSQIASVMKINYSISKLKYPAYNSKPEDFPEGNFANTTSPYFSMVQKHIPLFQDLLDNLLEEDYNKLSEEEKLKANVFKKMFNSEKQVVEFIDEKITKELDKEYSFYNPVNNINESGVSLRDMFENTSSIRGDDTYDEFTINRIFGYPQNKEITKAFYELRESIVKAEILTYMQAYRQYYMQVSTMRNKAQNANYILPDLYYTDEFFTQFSTITDVTSYMTLALTSSNSSIVYEIARETIYIYNDPIEVTVKTFTDSTSSKNIGYIPMLKTWYGDYTFDLVQTGENTMLQCTGCTSKQLDEQSLEERSNLMQRYNVDEKGQLFSFFKLATGIDPVEGKDNIYTPYELDDSWQASVSFKSNASKANSSGKYTYSTQYSNYSSYEYAGSGAPSYTYSTSNYLTPTGGSYPLAASNVRETMDFMERYSQWIIDKYGTSEYHRGIDYAVPIGTPVLAIRDGTITRVEAYSSGYGSYVEVTHADGARSRYGHGNGVFNVSVGDTVTAGTQIMESGNSGNSTGPHLHLEVIGADGNLVNPKTYAGLAT